jgi:TetR/AcrR family transcriptional repressor of mexJK operon
MDQVAALAAVSKQTVYKNFEDKEHLFRAVLTDITETADSFASEAVDSLQQTDDLTADLRHLARRYLSTVMQPHVLQLRRLIISEASRFPELGRSYYQRGPQRVLAALASSFDKLAERGWLRFEDPLLAANHFAFLVLAIPLDRALVCGDAAVPDTAEIERLADSAVSVFLSAYGNNQTRED